ncbi:class I SAM-dependent methyltransferase [Plantactinospora sp. KBS50]|uniref:class I SAM-dependent methyltransferase n=1 Tax=Plantactinospora sp. KBS50 TaxID=2024580 RepID=UPI0018DF9DFE|nr:class I SAM-dependent methyltransferase [Plantactinospora sp. KBS50]
MTGRDGAAAGVVPRTGDPRPDPHLDPDRDPTRDPHRDPDRDLDRDLDRDPAGGSRTCVACGGGPLAPVADLGEVPVECGVHWPDRAAALASPLGRMRLAVCPDCAYVRNLAFDAAALNYDTGMDTNLHHSAAFRDFSTGLVRYLAGRYRLAGGTVLDVGCGQGEFLRELCRTAGCHGVGYDAMYAGIEGPDPSGAVLHRGHAPPDGDLPRYDLVTSRHWLEHLDDPYTFLLRLREHAGARPVYGYLEVPDAEYDLATAGWEVIYPHVSYFAGYPLCRLVQRAGWRVVATGPLFDGMFRYVEISANAPAPTAASRLPARDDRDRQLTAVGGFAERHAAERRRWRATLARLVAGGDRPALWGAGSRGVQFLNLIDPERRLAAVVDVNPRKWGRYLPVTGHRVDPPGTLAGLSPRTVVITNPAYRAEVSDALHELGVAAELLVA